MPTTSCLFPRTSSESSLSATEKPKTFEGLPLRFANSRITEEFDALALARKGRRRDRCCIAALFALGLFDFARFDLAELVCDLLGRGGDADAGAVRATSMPKPTASGLPFKRRVSKLGRDRAAAAANLESGDEDAPSDDFTRLKRRFVPFASPPAVARSDFARQPMLGGSAKMLVGASHIIVSRPAGFASKMKNVAANKNKLTVDRADFARLN